MYARAHVVTTCQECGLGRPTPGSEQVLGLPGAPGGGASSNAPSSAPVGAPGEGGGAAEASADTTAALTDFRKAAEDIADMDWNVGMY